MDMIYTLSKSGHKLSIQRSKTVTDNKTDLNVQRIITLPVIVAFAVPVRPIIQRYQCPIDHTPTITPRMARVLFNPFLSFLLLLLSGEANDFFDEVVA